MINLLPTQFNFARRICALAVLCLLTGMAGAQDFSITTLTPNNALVVDVGTLVGDDRGGIAVSGSQAFLTGDGATARFNRDTLSSGVSVGTVRDGLVADLATGTVYLLGNGATPLPFGGGTLNSLIALDGATGVPNGTVINLSGAITLTGGGSSVGIFSGWGRIVLHTGTRAYRVSLPTGTVTDLGAMGIPARTGSESWAYWGVAENVGTETRIVYVANSTTIARTVVPSGPTTTVATFANLGDMASFTVSVPQNRWYFHSERDSQFGLFSESLGYADATFVSSPVAATITVQPTAVSVFASESSSFSVTASGSAPLTYQWRKGGVNIASATNSTYSIAVTLPSDADLYSVVVMNASGSATSSSVPLTVGEVDADFFKIVRLTANNAVTVDPGDIAGDDRGGLVVTPQKVFLRGDESVGSFNLDLTGGVQLLNPLAVQFERLAHDSLVSDLRSQKAYVLASDTTPLGILGGTVTRLVEINSTTGLPTGTSLTLDTPIVMPGTGLYNAAVGIFSGWGRIVLHNGTRAYSINTASGAVTDFGAMARPTRVNSESWAYWGVVEYFGGSHYIVYARDAQSIVRTRLPDGATTVISSFANLNDLANFTVVPGLNRWYFHNETLNQFSTNINFGGEILGYADAAFIFRPTAGLTLATNTVTVAEDAGLRSTPGFVTVAPASTASYNLTSDQPALFSVPPAVAADGTLTFTPAANANGSAVITVVGLNASAVPTGSATFTIAVTPVNDTPSFALTVATVTLLEDAGAQTLLAIATNISAGPVDEAAQTVSFLVTHDNAALFSVAPAISTNGTLTFTPATNAFGTATVTVRAQDNGGTALGGVDTSAPQTFTLTVNPVNDAPSFALAQAGLSVAEDSGPQTIANLATSILPGPANESTQTVSFLVTSDNGALFSAGPAVAANGTLTFTPAANAVGSATVTVRAQDNGGTANGGVDTSAAQTFTVTVTGVNDPPSFSLASTNLYANSLLGTQAVAAFSTGISPGPADEAGQTVAFEVSNSAPSLFTTPPALAANGTLTFTPVAGALGVATVTVIAVDSGGTAGGGVDRSTNTFILTLAPGNTAPSFTLAMTNVTVLEDAAAQTVASFVTSTSPGPVNESTQTVSVAVLTNSNPALFSTPPALAANGTLTFTPAANANGTATVTVVAQDSGGTSLGGADKSTNTFTVTVTAVNDAPSFALLAGTVAGRVLETWGQNANGQLGDGTTTTRHSPGQVGASTDWQSVTAGAFSTLAVKSGGTLWAWGNNSNGRLGDGTAVDKSSPVQIGPANNWQSVAGSFHTLAVKRDGTLWAWGQNAAGQLGDGTTIDRHSPVQIGTVTSWQSVAAGGSHTLAVRSDGTLWAWGLNALGRLGDGTTADKTSPVQIGAATNWESVATGGDHSVALKSDGTLWAWGGNGYGQLGDGSTVFRSSPVQIGTATDWQSVEAGSDHTVGLKSDGTLWAWGSNDRGQLGDGTTTDQRSPVQIGTATNWQSVTAGGSSTLALKSDGTLWAWGFNNSGQLGDGTTTERSSPVQIGTATNWQSAAVGDNHTVALAGTASAGPYTLTVVEDAGAQTVAAFATNILAGPADESGQLVSFTVTNNNNALFSVQPALSTNGTLTFTPATNAFGTATVTVTAQDNGGTANGGADTSAAQTFTLTVTAGTDAPVLTLQPTNLSLAVGGSGVFAVGATGGSPLMFQWLRNDLAISGATNSSLAFSNVQVASAGDYRVVVTNAYGAVTSSVARLTVGSSLNDDLVAWYPLDGDLLDYSGNGRNGTATNFTPSYLTGVVGQALKFAGTAQNRVDLTTWVPGTNSFTFSGWVKYDATNEFAFWPFDPVVMLFSSGSGDWSHGFAVSLNIRTNGVIPAFSVVSAQGSSVTLRGTNNAAAGVWHHLVGVMDRAAGQIRIYWNGALVGSTSVAGYGAINSAWSHIGGFHNGTSHNAAHAARQDDVRIYSRALGEAEILSLASALHLTAQPTSQTAFAGQSATLTVAALGTAPLTYQWRKAGVNLDGGTNAQLTFNPVTADDAGNYDVVVSDATGSVTSSVVALTVNLPNVAPSFAFSAATVAALEDAGARTVAALVTNIVAGPVSEAAQVVTFSVTNNSPALFASQPAISANGTLTFTPAPNANGSTLVAVVAQDNGGTAGGGVDRSTNTFTIAVTAVNDAPSFALAAGQGTAVIAWGPNDLGQTNVPANLTDVRAVASGRDFSMALRSNGTVVVWGDSGYGVLAVPADLTNAVEISGGYRHAVARRSDGSIVAWGGGVSAGLVTNIPASITNVAALSAGGGLFNLALKTDGTVVGWGENGFGQLTIPTGLSNVTAISAGGVFSMALKSDGTVVAWGANGSGQSTVPAGLTNVIGISAGDGHALAVRADGTVVCWGQVTGVPSVVTNVVRVQAGALESFALRADGTVVQWSELAVRSLPASLVSVTALSARYFNGIAISGGSGGVTVLEDAGAQTVASFATNISPGPADEAGQTVSFLVTNDNAALFSVAPAISANGTLTFTPATNAFGTATVTVIAQDNGGTANGGVDTSAPQTFTITVNAVNDAPSFTKGADQLVFSGDGAVAVTNWATGISAGPADEAGQSVSFVVTNSDSSKFTVAPAVSAAGVLTFTPAAGAAGVVTVGVRAVDSGGTANGGVDTSAVQPFTVSLAATKVFLPSATVAGAGELVTVPVSLRGAGAENGVAFTLSYPSALLTFTSASVGGNSAGASVLANPNVAGQLGLLVTKPLGQVWAAGSNEVALVTFTVASGAAGTNAALAFGDAVVTRQVADTNAVEIAPVLYVGGSVTVAVVDLLEGDVTPRPTGNGLVTVSDAIQVSRFAAGLDTITNFGVGGEFQRADTAPRTTLGDGRITVADAIQAQRYAAGLDPATGAGGPSAQPLGIAAAMPTALAAGNRTLRVMGGSLVAGRANTVSVQLDAQGNEAGLQFSLGFDPAVLSFVSASAGSGAAGATVVANTQRVGLGRVGLLVVMPAGSSVAVGTRDVLTLTFTVNGAGSTAVTVLNHTAASPREVADMNATPVGATYVGGSFNILLPAGLKAAGMERAADGSLRLVVRNSDGTPVTAAQAAKYAVHVTSNLGGVWTLLPNALVVENGALKIVDPAATSAGLRLYKLVELP